MFRKHHVITDVEALLDEAMRLEARGELPAALPDLLRRSVTKSTSAVVGKLLADAVELEFSMRANLDDALEDELGRHPHQGPPLATPAARDDIKTITDAFVPIWVMGGFDATGTEFEALARSDRLKSDAAVNSVIERGVDAVIAVLWTTLSFSALADPLIDWDTD